MTAPVSPSDDVVHDDDRALELRRKGKGLKSIAAELGLGRAVDANRAFNRALRRRPPEEQAVFRAEEEDRLDKLADAVRRDDTMSPEVLERRLRSVERLRGALLSE